jgi:hypothetical protein
MNKAYETHNPSFADMTLEQQIDVGINDWALEGRSGHLYFGRTAAEAMAIAQRYDFK